MRRAFVDHAYPRLPARLAGLLARIDSPKVDTQQDVPPEVLERFGLAGQTARRIPGGLVNTSWIVGHSVLRRYNKWRQTDAIRGEHDVLDHLAAKHWPVAMPTPAADGSTIVEHDGRSWSLFPLLPGKQRPLAADLGGRGRMLARLHADMADFPRDTTRDMLSFDRIGWWVPGDRRGLRDLLGELREPGLADAIRVERDRVFADLEAIGMDGLERTVVHGDYHGGNILYVHRTVSGLLDFDFVHSDLAVVDLGIASGFLRRPRFIARFLRGYRDERPLGEREVRLIGPLIRARGLEHIAFLLAARPAATEDEIVARARSTLDEVRRARAGSRAFERELLARTLR